MAKKNDNGSSKKKSKKSSSKDNGSKKVDYQKMLDDAPSKVVKRQLEQELKRKKLI